jgi:hypothetical protein
VPGHVFSSRVVAQAQRFTRQGTVMGCMPLPLLFLLGTGLGYLVDGRTGALWGAGMGLAVGLAATAAFIARIRGKR